MNFERIFQNCIGNFCVIFILQLPELSQFAVGLFHIQLFIRWRAWFLMFFREASKFRKWGIAHLLTNLKSRNSTLNWQIYELIRLIEHIFDSQQWWAGHFKFFFIDSELKATKLMIQNSILWILKEFFKIVLVISAIYSFYSCPNYLNSPWVWCTFSCCIRRRA